MSTETLRQALKDCLDWMESLRACGDAGNWEWGAASEYARGIAALEAKDEPVQVSPLQFVEMVMEKEHLVGKPIFWAEWPNKEKNT